MILKIESPMSVMFPVVLLILLNIYGAYGNSKEQNIMNKVHNQDCAERIVDKYIKETKQWLEGEYDIQFNRVENSNLIYWVIHQEDKSTQTTGGKSVEVYIHGDTLEVIQELHFQ